MKFYVVSENHGGWGLVTVGAGGSDLSLWITKE